MKYHFRFFIFAAVVLLLVFYVHATPNAVITPAPQFPNHLIPRQDAGPNVYGYIDGNINSPLGCGAGYQFAKQDDLGACCNEATCTSVYFTCVNEGEPDPCRGESSYLCNMGLGMITALSCKEPTPSCYQYMVMSSPQDINAAYISRCGTASTVVQVYLTATNEEDATLTADKTAEDETSAATRTSKSRKISSSNTSSEENAGSIGDAEEPSVSGASSTNKSNNSNKLIIIIVVVGVVVLATIVAGVLYLRRRQRRSQEKIHDPVIPSYISVIPTNYAGSDDGSNPVLENPARLNQMNEWNDGIQAPASNNERAVLMPPPIPPRN